MAKKAVSLTLDEKNLLWLQGLASRSGARSLSETVDRILTDARATQGAAGTPTSVVGTIDIDRSDAALDEADAAIRSLFDRSLARPFLVREDRVPMRTRPRGRGRRG